MNTECLRDCSSTELLTAQKQIAKILKTRHGTAKHIDNSRHVPSRSSSRCSGKSRVSRKSMDHDFTSSKSKAKRSQSLIDLRDEYSAISCVDSINKKYRETYKDHHHISFGHSGPGKVAIEDSDEDDGVTAPSEASLSTSLSHVTYSKAQESEIRSKQYQKLSSAVKRLYLILEDVHKSTVTPCRQRSRSPSAFFEKKLIPRFYEKDSILKLTRIVDTLTKNVQKQVSHLIIVRRKEKPRFDETKNDNALLKQRLNNSLIIQRNLEGELKELNKEKKLLELENKNLAIKIVPFLNENNKGTSKAKNEFTTAGKARRQGSSYRHALDDENNNNSEMESGSRNNCNSAHCSKSLFRCSRRSSLINFNSTRCWYNNEEDDTLLVVSQSVSDSNLTMDSSPDEISKAEEIIMRRAKRKIKSRDELDSIATYVKWKSQDFNRLHGNLHKSFEELQQLKQTMNFMSEEKSEILADLEDLVDSYRELERERDNYESILKMILKEKNSSESNIRELLDGLLVHLNNPPTQNSRHHRCCQEHECSSSTPTASESTSHHHYCSNSKSFLESALNVIQEQNISIREEMARLRESLQNTAGQNTVLQANNQSLMEKVNDLQRQMENKEMEAEQKEREHKEKFENLDKLYNTILSAKEELENRLVEKEREIARLNLKTVTDASEKALKEQSEKINELKEANAKLEREVAKFRASNEKLNTLAKQFKIELKEQKGNLSDQMKSTCTELQKSKEQCNWLQSQIDNFKAQLQEAHERIKLQEKDKAVLAHKVLSAEEERKILDRNIKEIRTIMEADKLYQQALSERNEVLQSEVNRLRTEKLSGDSMLGASAVVEREQSSSAPKKGEDGDGSGEKRNSNSNSVNKAAVMVKTLLKSKPPTSSGKENISSEIRRPVNVKPVCCSRHKCPLCPAKAKKTSTSTQRTAAAKRLSNELSSNGPRRQLRECHCQCPFKVKAAASSGLQDSTLPLKPLKCVHLPRTTASSHSIGSHNHNSLLCTSGKRPLVALVRVKRRPLMIN